jgi:hypothetical protein
MKSKLPAVVAFPLIALALLVADGTAPRGNDPGGFDIDVQASAQKVGLPPTVLAQGRCFNGRCF